MLEDEGFTLIELMVVLLILAILMAIAIPTFLGVTGSANNRATQSNLKNALTTVTSFYQSNNQSFITPQAAAAGPDSGQSSVNKSVLASDLASSDPNLYWTSGYCSKKQPNCISFEASNDGTGIALAAYSLTGECWYIVFDPTEAIYTVSSGLGAGESSGATGHPGVAYGENSASVLGGQCAAFEAMLGNVLVSNWAPSFAAVVK